MAFCVCSLNCRGDADATTTTEGLRIEYFWRSGPNRTSHCLLTMDDSLLRFYPYSDNSKILQIRHLSPVAVDSIKLFAGRVKNSGFQPIDTFSLNGILVEYSLNLEFLGGDTEYCTPPQLNQYLLSLLQDVPGDLYSAFPPIAENEATYSGGHWRELQLKIHPTDINHVSQVVTLTHEGGTYSEPDESEYRLNYHISDTAVEELDSIVALIDRSAEFIYWVQEDYDFSDSGEEQGVSLWIDGRRVAVVSSWGSMPTRPLRHLFAVMYELTPVQLNISSDGYSSVFQIPDI